MPAPKGNKSAIKGLEAKTRGYRLRLTDKNLLALQKIAKSENCKISDVLEKALVAAYPKIFDGQF